MWVWMHSTNQREKKKQLSENATKSHKREAIGDDLDLDQFGSINVFFVSEAYLKEKKVPIIDEFAVLEGLSLSLKY